MWSLGLICILSQRHVQGFLFKIIGRILLMSLTFPVGLCGEFRMSILVFGVMALYQNKGIKMCDKGKCAVQRREGAYNGIAQNLK